MLTRDQARSFYDAFGREQDDQAWYEEPALDVVVEHGRFDEATALFEFGCGTGRCWSTGCARSWWAAAVRLRSRACWSRRPGSGSAVRWWFAGV